MIKLPDCYQPYRQPRAHQLEALERSWDQEVFALMCEPRTGKSQIVLDTLALRWHRWVPTTDPASPAWATRADPQGKPHVRDLDALLVVALPSGAPANWVRDEIPQVLDPALPVRAVVWDAAHFSTKRYQAQLEELLWFQGIAVLAVNGEAVITANFRKWAPKFLRGRRTLLVGDETTLIMKTPGAARTRLMHSMARYYRPKTPGGRGIVALRILDGTPVGEGALDLFSQFRFLEPKDQSPILGHTSFFAFKHRYAVWERGYAKNQTHDFEVQKRDENGKKIYQHLDELYARIAPFSFRVRFRDVSDAPPKVYQKHRFSLSPEQRRVYDELEANYQTQLRTQATVTAAHVLARYTRLQQVISNYWPPQAALELCSQCQGAGCEACDDLGARATRLPLTPIDEKHHPKLDALRHELTRLGGQAIVWCRFDEEVADCLRVSTELGRKPVRYDGKVSPEDKYLAKTAFQAGDAGDLVAKVSSAGRALTLSRADLLVYYTNTYSLLDRLQSEERAEATDKKTSTGIVDLIAEDTKDDEILACLRDKREVSDLVLQERTGAWL